MRIVGVLFFVLLAAGWFLYTEGRLCYFAIPILLCSVFFLIGSNIFRPHAFSWGRFRFTDEHCTEGFFVMAQHGQGKTNAIFRGYKVGICKNLPSHGSCYFDVKGDSGMDVLRICEENDCGDDAFYLTTRPEEAPRSWMPKVFFNPALDPYITPTSLSALICDAAKAKFKGKMSASAAHFHGLAQDNIACGIDAFKALNVNPALDEIQRTLSSRDRTGDLIAQLLSSTSDECLMTAERLQDYLSLAPDEFSGAKSTLTRYLMPFTLPDMKEVFCSNRNSFTFKDIEKGKKIICSIPSSSILGQEYMYKLLVISVFKYALTRYERDVNLYNTNLGMIEMDECQDLLFELEDGIDVATAIPKIRAGGVGFFGLTQLWSSVLNRMSPSKARTFTGNLSTKVSMYNEDVESQKIQAGWFGSKYKWSYSYSTGSSGGRASRSRTRKKEEVPNVRVSDIDALHKFECYIKHGRKSKGWGKLYVPPMEYNGALAKWFKKGQSD